MEITLEQVKEFFEQNKDNKEVKAYLEGLKKVSVQEVQQMLVENEELKRWFDSEKDRHFSKGLETFKQKTMPKLIEEEIKKRFPEADPKDVKLKELEAKIVQMEQEKLREAMKNKALTLATEKKLPIQLIDYFIGQDEESTLQNLAKLEEVWTQNLQALVEEKLKTSGVNPKDSNVKTQTFTREQIEAMTHEEIQKNWDLIKDQLKNI
jgi:Fe-S-cluster formation regulator IscX/YfhJ